MQLIYFSPVPWASFRQRPHEFVEWAHDRLDASVLWVEPYPARLPRWSDLSRPRLAATALHEAPPWLECLRPRALPLEPLAAGRAINRRVFWPPLLQHLKNFAKQDSTVLVIGKPSDLAMGALENLPVTTSLYDAMDDFPAFHSGAARTACARIEREIIVRSMLCCTSSKLLADRMRALGTPTLLVPNGLASARMPPAQRAPADTRNFGYIGTVGPWFDWDWVCELANDWPDRRVEIHGPQYQAVPTNLPANIVVGTAMPHEAALRRMQGFAVGLIPFRRNELTASVDPVKYYEYRALGIPVISTPFGEMHAHGHEPRVLLAESPRSAHAAILDLLASVDTAESTDEFRRRNDWSARFEPLAAHLAPRS